MKRITKRVQQLGQRAEQLREIVNQMPGRVEGMRQSVFSAAEKLQQVRADLTASAGMLRGQAETDAVGLLAEIGNVGELLEGSGFVLEGVDWDIASSRRVQVRIGREGETDVRMLRVLLSRHDGKPAARTILTALIQAQEAAEELTIGRLVWTDVVIDLGMVPAVRIGWREVLAEEDEEAPLAALPGSGGAEAPPPLPAAPVSSPHYTPGTFLRPREAAPAAEEPVVVPVSAPPVAAVATPRPAPQVKRDPMSLERFKKMPKVGR